MYRQKMHRQTKIQRLKMEFNLLSSQREFAMVMESLKVLLGLLNWEIGKSE